MTKCSFLQINFKTKIIMSCNKKTYTTKRLAKKIKRKEENRVWKNYEYINV